MRTIAIPSTALASREAMAGARTIAAVGVGRSNAFSSRAASRSVAAFGGGFSTLHRGLSNGEMEQRGRIGNMKGKYRAFASMNEDADNDNDQPSTSSSSSSSTTPDIATLRSQLEAAVEAEDYALAANIRDSLRALEDDAVAGVTEANARFYAAFRAADIDVMASCLGEGDHVTVIHPGCNAIRGREAVLESWRVIFSGATRAAGKGAAVALDIEAVEMQVYAPALPSNSGSDSDSHTSKDGKGTGAIGVVTCVERVDGGDATGRIVATNVFERGGDGRYRMILHHGSSAPPMRR